jgi:hypothetical protein
LLLETPKSRHRYGYRILRFPHFLVASSG